MNLGISRMSIVVVAARHALQVLCHHFFGNKLDSKIVNIPK